MAGSSLVAPPRGVAAEADPSTRLSPNMWIYPLILCAMNGGYGWECYVMEQTFGSRRQEMETNAWTACTVAEYGHHWRVSAERSDVPLRPLQRYYLIQHAIIAICCSVFCIKKTCQQNSTNITARKPQLLTSSCKHIISFIPPPLPPPYVRQTNLPGY